MSKREIKEMVNCPIVGSHIKVEECKRRGFELGCFKGVSLGKIVCEQNGALDVCDYVVERGI